MTLNIKNRKKVIKRAPLKKERVTWKIFYNFRQNPLWLDTLFTDNCIPSVIRQKGESQNGCLENKARQIFQKTNISYPLIRTHTCAYEEVRNVRFSENLTRFVFLKDSFWNSLFCVITDDTCFNIPLFFAFFSVVFKITSF